ncbi:MAG TPA: hypothetical protein VK932_31260 [Kofleriaceae bacterium]|nr:hypothetical protein [Kofleriaceae bacterium]
MLLRWAELHYGEELAGRDVDLVADLRAAHVAPFVERLQADYYVDADIGKPR